jgi:photosystem I P700 chlorophyll a apoprotein A1
LDAGVAPQEIPLPLLINCRINESIIPKLLKGLAPFFSGHWGEYSDFLTFKGGLNPVTGGLWLTDIAFSIICFIYFRWSHVPY